MEIVIYFYRVCSCIITRAVHVEVHALAIELTDVIYAHARVAVQLFVKSARWQRRRTRFLARVIGTKRLSLRAHACLVLTHKRVFACLIAVAAIGGVRGNVYARVAAQLFAIFACWRRMWARSLAPAVGTQRRALWTAARARVARPAGRVWVALAIVLARGARSVARAPVKAKKGAHVTRVATLFRIGCMGSAARLVATLPVP